VKYLLIFAIVVPVLCRADVWQMVSDKNNIRLYVQSSIDGALPFKAETTFDVAPDILFNILMDYPRKHHWSPKLKKVKLHRKNHDEYIFSEYYSTPWPASDREFLLRGVTKKLLDGGFVLYASSLMDKKLEDPNYVQADVKILNFKARRISENQTHVVFEFQGDIKGFIPIWISNIIQRKWPRKFLLALKGEVDKIQATIN
jgi:hypothetical protein